MTGKQLIATPLPLKKIKPMDLPNNPNLHLDDAERILTKFLIDDIKDAEEEFIQQIQNELKISKKCARLYFEIFYTIQIEQIPQNPNNLYDIPGFKIIAKPHSAEQALQLMEVYEEEYNDCIKQIIGVTDDWKQTI